MVFAICGALRLARFNVMIDDRTGPPGEATSLSACRRRRAPITVLLPIYAVFLGMPRSDF